MQFPPKKESNNCFSIDLVLLYVDYMLSMGCPGPVKSGKRWLEAWKRRCLEPELNPFPESVDMVSPLPQGFLEGDES